MADKKFLGTKDEEMGVISMLKVRDRRYTDERAKRSGIKIKKN